MCPIGLGGDKCVATLAVQEDEPLTDERLGGAGAPEAEEADEEEEEEDPVAAAQSVDAYNSLEDGQPGSPGALEYTLFSGMERGLAPTLG